MQPASGSFNAISSDLSGLIIVHGGAWNIPSEEENGHCLGMRVALAIGQERLASGAPAIEIGAAVVASMESDGAFDAGKGAVLMQNGRVELDAGLMNGESLQFGAVANIQHFLHPIAIARRILEVGRRQFSFLAGAGAEVFAEAQGFERMRNEALICERERVRFERLQWAANRYHTSDPFPMRPPAQ